MWPILFVVAFTLLSGVGDTYGFTYASRIWKEDHLVWSEALKSAVGFTFGFVTYWVAIRYLKRLGIEATEIQTLLWFAVTILGIALLSGKFFHWQRIDQMIAVAVLAGIGWLLFRTGG